MHTLHLETHRCRFVFTVPVWKINGSDFALDAFHKSLKYFKFLLKIPFVAVLWSLSLPAESEESDSVTDFSLRHSKIKQIHWLTKIWRVIHILHLVLHLLSMYLNFFCNNRTNTNTATLLSTNYNNLLANLLTALVSSPFSFLFNSAVSLLNANMSSQSCSSSVNSASVPDLYDKIKTFL